MDQQEVHAFSEPRPVRAEPDLSTPGSGAPQYNVDESGSTWELDGLDGSQEQKYYDNQSGGNSQKQQVQGGSKGVNRS